MPGGSGGLPDLTRREVESEAGSCGCGGGGGGGYGEAEDGDGVEAGVSAFLRWLWIFS